MTIALVYVLREVDYGARRVDVDGHDAPRETRVLHHRNGFAMESPSPEVAAKQFRTYPQFLDYQCDGMARAITPAVKLLYLNFR